MKLVKALILVLLSSYSANAHALFGQILNSWSNSGSTGATVESESGDGWTSTKTVSLFSTGAEIITVNSFSEVNYGNGVVEKYDQLSGVQTNYFMGTLCYDPSSGINNCGELAAYHQQQQQQQDQLPVKNEDCVYCE